MRAVCIVCILATNQLFSTYHLRGTARGLTTRCQAVRWAVRGSGFPFYCGTHFLWLVAPTSYGWWEPPPMVGGNHFLWLVAPTSYGWWAPLPMVGGNHFLWLVGTTSYGWWEPLLVIDGRVPTSCGSSNLQTSYCTCLIYTTAPLFIQFPSVICICTSIMGEISGNHNFIQNGGVQVSEV